MKVEVARYRKRDGWLTRHWAVFVNGDLLAVTVYRKGALAVAAANCAITRQFNCKDLRWATKIPKILLVEPITSW